jgi:dienelactone hydrolase
MVLSSLIITALLFFILSIYFSPLYNNLPKPTGPYSIGTALYHVIDSNRRENHSDNKNDKRELMIQVWYPSSTTDRPAWHYLSDVMHALNKDIGKKIVLPKALFTYFSAFPTYATLNPSIYLQDKPYPVIIFSHGFGALPALYTSYIEELVSNGYIVVGINHTYASKITVFPDGRIAKFRRDKPLKNLEEVQAELDKWVADIRFVMDELTHFNKADILLKNHIDMNNIGILGHSFGGIAALATSRVDNRCKATINLDGPLRCDKDHQQAFHKPILFMVQDHTRSSSLIQRLIKKNLDKKGYINNTLSDLKQFCTSINGNAYLVLLKKAGHHTFTDFVLLKYPLEKLIPLDLGKLKHYKAIMLINRYILDFFDIHLRDKPSKICHKLKHGEINDIPCS